MLTSSEFNKVLGSRDVRLVHGDVTHVIPAVTLTSIDRKPNHGRPGARIKQGDSEPIFSRFEFPGDEHGVLVNRITRQPLPDIGIKWHNHVSDIECEKVIAIHRRDAGVEPPHIYLS